MRLELPRLCHLATEFIHLLRLFLFEAPSGRYGADPAANFR